MRWRHWTHYLAIPGFVNGSQVLSSLFNEREQDQTEELVRNTVFHDVFDALDEEDGEEGDEGKGQD